MGFSDMLERLGSFLFYILAPPVVENMEPMSAKLKTNRAQCKDKHTHLRRQSMGEGVREHYSVISELGKSAFSTVLQAHDHLSNRLHAVKVFRKGDIDKCPATRLDRVRREIRALHTLRHHAHIVHINHAREDEDYIYIAMEYCHLGSLSRLLCGTTRAIEERRALQILGDVLSAVAYMHRCGISHGDIKPDNVLLTARGVVKLADFSAATWKRPVEGNLSTRAHKADGYAAPEACGAGMGAYHTQLADMWSCGALLYTLLTRDVPCLTHRYYNGARNIHRPSASQWSSAHKKEKLTQQGVSDMIRTSRRLTFISTSTLRLLEALLTVSPHDRVEAVTAGAMCDDSLRLLTEKRRQRALCHYN